VDPVAPPVTATTGPAPESTAPAVSVVIATRDRPELLARAVRSVFAQDYPGPVEVLAVFDQSPPAPVDAGEASGRTLRVLTNTRKPGLAGARNSGIEASSAPLVAFCDDDDEWDPGKLTAQAPLLASGPAGLAACGVRIHHSGQAVTRTPPASAGLADLARSRVSALHPSAFLIRRELLDRIGLIDEEIPGSYGEDYDLLLRAARRHPVVSVQQPLVNVYWHPQSFFAERWQVIADALDYLLAKHPELSADPRGLARIQGQIAFARAALGDRSAARRSARQALRGNPAEHRAYLALAVATRALPAAWIVRQLNRHGRGI
jgi:glycosyltransferase involved in cell wall biosynthesis